MEEGEDPMTAARKGTAEIGLAVMATTFTILAVFLPVGFMTGLVGSSSSRLRSRWRSRSRCRW
jgi:HAE1 family hydrophobic/amphiphilic exporter-1